MIHKNHIFRLKICNNINKCQVFSNMLYANACYLTECLKLQYPGNPPNELQHIKLSVIDQHDCLSTSFRVTNKNICTLTKKGEGACHVSYYQL